MTITLRVGRVHGDADVILGRSFGNFRFEDETLYDTAYDSPYEKTNRPLITSIMNTSLSKNYN